MNSAPFEKWFTDSATAIPIKAAAKPTTPVAAAVGEPL